MYRHCTGLEVLRILYALKREEEKNKEKNYANSVRKKLTGALQIFLYPSKSQFSQ